MESEKPKPPNAGNGRVKGVPNKTTKILKEAILLAADQAGGKNGLVGYLTTQAKKCPSAFLPLLGKVLPLQVVGANDGPVALVYGDVNSLSDTDLMKIIAGRNGKPDA